MDPQTWAGRTFWALVLGALILAVAAGPVLAASGDLLWTRRYDAYSGRDEVIADMAIDSSGNIYVCGWADKGSGSTIDYDLLLVKYSPTGAKLWSNTWNMGVPNRWEMGYALACDDSGSVYVTGWSNERGHQEMILLKYTPAGVLGWSAGSGPYGIQSRGKDIVVLPGGGGWITGSTSWSRTSAMMLWSFTPTGGVANLHERPGATGVAIRFDGENVIICGSADGGMFIEKLAPLGAPVWEKRIGPQGVTPYTARAVALGLDSADNVYVTGYIETRDGGSDIATLKISDSGGLRWMRRYAGSARGDDVSHAIAVSNSSGVIAVTGYSNVSRYLNRRALTLRYASNGHLMWARRHLSTAVGNSVWVGPGGNVYVAGEAGGTASGRDYSTLRYSPLGALRWFRRYNKSSGKGDMARKVVVNSSGCYVSGISYSGTGEEHEDIATLKYVP